MSRDLRSGLGMLLALDAQRADPSDLLRHGCFLTPDGPGPHPAVMYCHAHGGRYDLGARELTEGARWLTAPYAPDLLRAGFAVLCIDMPGFGARQGDGTESALAKAGMWQGRPLFGQMVALQLQALAWLRRQPLIAAGQIVTLGTSMGAALAMWVAALDTRVRACAQLCILANIAPLIASGAHDRHGPYLTVPGLLGLADMGEIAGLIAPRPQFIGLGANDPFTPPQARDPALQQVRQAYTDLPDALTVHIDADAAHGETRTMRRAVLDFLGKTARTAIKEGEEHA